MRRTEAKSFLSCSFKTVPTALLLLVGLGSSGCGTPEVAREPGAAVAVEGEANAQALTATTGTAKSGKNYVLAHVPEEHERTQPGSVGNTVSTLAQGQSAPEADAHNGKWCTFDCWDGCWQASRVTWGNCNDVAHDLGCWNARWCQPNVCC